MDPDLMCPAGLYAAKQYTVVVLLVIAKAINFSDRFLAGSRDDTLVSIVAVLAGRFVDRQDLSFFHDAFDESVVVPSDLFMTDILIQQRLKDRRLAEKDQTAGVFIQTM